MTMDPLLPRLGAPSGLVVETFEEGGETYALLEWLIRPAFPDASPLGAPGRIPRAQREVLDLLLGGLSNEEIARHRHRSPRTVAHQVDTLFRRLEVGSRAELLALAARQGWHRGKP
jgi:DNA-binding NarL/FixJ family response regulator